MSLNRTECLLGLYIALYLGIPENGVDEILGFNLPVILLGLTLLSYIIGPRPRAIKDGLTAKYVSVQLFFAFAFIISSSLMSDVNYYGTFMNFAQFSVLMFLMGKVINDNNYKAFLQFFVIGCLLNSLLVVGGSVLGFHTINYNGEEESRITIIGRDNNESSIIHNISIVIALFFIREKKWIIVNAIAVVLSIITILVTGSRTGLVICLCVVVMNLILSSKGWKQRLILLMGSMLLLCAIIYVATKYLDDSILDRYMNISTEIESGTMANRTIIWSHIINSYNKSSLIEKVFGHGWNTTPLYTFRGYDAHNVFLKMAIEFGIVGVIVVCSYLMFFVRNAFKRRKSSYGFLLGGVTTCVFLSFMTLSWIYNIIIWIVFLLMHKVIVCTK